MDWEKLASSGELTAWYALTVKFRHEKAVARNFHTQGLEVFLPVYRARRAWCDRIKVVELPLFPEYVFCRFDPRNRVQILRMPSVTSIVSFNNTLAPIEDAVIASIRTIIQSGVLPKMSPYLQAGQAISVKSGALKGLQGTLVREKGSCRVVVNLELLRSSVAVELDREMVSALSD